MALLQQCATLKCYKVQGSFILNATTQAVVFPWCDMRKALLLWRSSEDVVYKSWCEEFPQRTHCTSLWFLFIWMFHVFLFFFFYHFFFYSLTGLVTLYVNVFPKYESLNAVSKPPPTTPGIHFCWGLYLWFCRPKNRQSKFILFTTLEQSQALYWRWRNAAEQWTELWSNWNILESAFVYYGIGTFTVRIIWILLYLQII